MQTLMNTRRSSFVRATVLTAALFFSVQGGAIAGQDEDAVMRNVEAFRTAQVAANGPALTGLSAADLSFSHSDGRVEDRAAFVAGATSGRAKFLFMDFRNPTVKVVGNTAMVRLNMVSEQEIIADGKRNPINLHILMVWQQQGGEWKLLARSATRL